MTCPTCGGPTHAAPQAWEVRCIACGKQKWPRVVSRPENYVCALCRLGGARQVASKESWKRRKASQNVQAATAGPKSGAVPA